MYRKPSSFFLTLFLLFLSISAFAQSRTVTGRLTDQATNQPISGVNVSVKGTTTTVVTDAEGRYSIIVPNNQATLVFSYVGYGTQEIPVGTSTSLSPTLSSAQNSMDEVVVVGYGTSRRRDLTGAVTSIKSDVITQTPTHNPLEAIQGRATGVDLTRASGAPGSGVNINIRGFKSIPPTRDQIYERNSPLVIIDGFQGGDLSTINSSDIESIDILKDASATAIYGAQGGNGVIIVTTKRGAAGRIRVNYSGYYGVNEFVYPKLRIGEDYLNLRREALRNPPSGPPQWTGPADDPKLFVNLPGEAAAVAAGKWADWMDLLTKNGTINSHTVSLSAGSDRTKFFLSSGYFNEEGFLKNQDYTRYNVRLNVDQTLSRIFKAGISTQIAYSIQNNRRDPFGQAFTISPLGDVYDSVGRINQFPLANDNRISPLADERNEFISRDNIIRTNLLAGGYLEIAPLRGLTVRTNFNATLNFSRRGTYNDRTSLAQNGSSVGSLASQTTGFSRFLDWNNVITYTKPIGDHTFTLTGITSYLRSDDDQLTASGSGQILASQLYYGLAGTSTAVTRNISSPFFRWTNLAYAGRLNYSYKGKYVVYLSGRYDGASRLSEGNKWSFFPAAGVAWNVADENFMKNITSINYLKLRGTYGVSGNYNIDVYGTQSGLTFSPRMSFGEVPAPAYMFNPTVGNPDLGWEKTTTTNIGLDFGLFRSRITGTVDWFRSKTSDILYRRVLPQSSGVTDVYENIASTLNKGIEVAITSQNVQGKNFRWSSTLTYTKTNQKILDIVDGRDILHPSASERESLLIGRPITAFYTYVKEGIWQQNEAAAAASLRFGSATGNTFKPGDIKLRDISGPAGKPDGIIDATYDRAFIGSTVPDWVGGLQNTFNYKNFDLGVFLLFRYGQMIDAEILGRYNSGGFGNGPAMIDYWTPQNPTNDFPRPLQNSTIISYAGYQTLTFVDGSFFKVKNITLGYTLPKSISQKIASDNIRFYITGNNVLTVTKSHLIKDYDPERGGSLSNPIGRQFVIGINAGF
ncbi:MAG: TonB-dependent receptor [Chitinophagaceae bacterium]|nr:MAG: TonB-dependent receptor [Chitinophagaceae bacterium]